MHTKVTRLKWRWEKWKQSNVLLTMQRVWWWSWAHSSVAFCEGSVWWQESQSFLLLKKRRGTIRGDLAGEDERDVPVVPATSEGAPGRGTCATAGEAGLTAIRRSLGLCIPCTQPILLSPSSSFPANSTGELKTRIPNLVGLWAQWEPELK